ncbi:diguanylate cyclase [Paenibacillus xylanexedens]|uniref:sensor domain-containing protein n=1 Tax=Paenibacillus xylanexedens TaxID=528191 RepID=UPI001F2B746D|nr:diguanylate cyclase [Paenibacillus xylanexedens]MCF7754155.1 diguanylate cyclase [Paenibacillus xylanexedens]
MKEFLSEQSIEAFRSIINHNPDATFIVSNEGTIVEVNEGVTECLGFQKKEIMGSSYKDLFCQHQLDLISQYFSEVLKGASCQYVAEAHHKNGEIIYLQIKQVPLFFEGKVNGIFGVAKNITEYRQLLKALKESEERYRLLADNSLDLIQLINLDGIVEYASPSHKMVLGFDPKEYIGKWVFYQPNGDVDDKFRTVFMSMLLLRKPFTYEIKRQHEQGYPVWLEMKGTPMFDEDGDFKNMMLVGREITERKKYQVQLEQLSYHDALTGAPNRRYLNKMLSDALSEATTSVGQLAVMFADLDNFKQINDTLGHDAGDELLRQFVKRAGACLQEHDVLARMGGDEFVFVLPHVKSSSELSLLAENILETLQLPWILDGKELYTTSSIGIAFYEEDDSVKELLQKADAALYLAKAEGKNTYRIYSFRDLSMR